MQVDKHTSKRPACDFNQNTINFGVSQRLCALGLCMFLI
jgi:hypothetical protein